MDASQRDSEAGAAAVPTRTLVAAVVLGWLIPGAGHFLLGRRRRAVAFFLLVMSSLTIGCLLQGELYRAIGPPLTTLATAATAGVGAAYFVLLSVVGYTGSLQAVGYEYGKAFILTAGLMNILLLLDVWDIGRGEKE